MNSPARAPDPLTSRQAEPPVRPGQRWINHARPELGLGLVIAVEGRTVTLRFGEEERDHVFSLESAPLSRIRFAAGDVVRTIDGGRVAIDRVHERGGVFVYEGIDVDGSRAEVAESMIAADQSFNRPAERLLHGQIDEVRWFTLRRRTLLDRHRLQADPLWGLGGGRTALLPHQLYVAHEVAQRHAPRVLLADEVGLGKTIEAGLVVHSQLLGERIRRVLVVVPESLVHQWLVEMLRRFNLAFSVFDVERIEAMTDGDEETPGNPFAEEQRVLVSRELLHEERYLGWCLQADFDLLIVDEAHHLNADDAAAPAWQAVSALAGAIPSVLLLTGTPHRLGLAGHYQRLRLLDPDRYHDPRVLEAEQEDLAPLAALVDTLLAGDEPDAAQREQLAEVVEDDAAGSMPWQSETGRETVVGRLLDRFGTGRVMFRNTRAGVGGFPPRRVHRHDLAEAPAGDGKDEGLRPRDPRLAWLGDWLAARPGEKALVICTGRHEAVALGEALKRGAGISCAAFHEELSLVERDRAAAWFADPDDGCQVLVCSEIGSEGRNFQFAAHLVLFDLPDSPELLEQRIGRLDRIGRDTPVDIHVPLADPRQTRLYRWYHEGLHAFEEVGSVNPLVHEEMADELAAALAEGGEAFEDLLERTRQRRQQLAEHMGAGRDRLLEAHSCRPGVAAARVEDLHRRDHDGSVRDFIEQAGGCYDISLEPYRRNSVLLVPGERLPTVIPGLPERGLAATFDRTTALQNEDLAFLTWEHPLVTAIADLVLNTERGNATICALTTPHLPRGRLAVECVFVIEAPLFTNPALAGYVPPLLESGFYDEQGRRMPTAFDHDHVNQRWAPLKPKAARAIIALRRDMLRGMLDAAGADLAGRAEGLLRHHGQAGLARLREELARLRYLSRVNPLVRAEEISHLAGVLDAVETAIGQPRVRLDAVRVLIGL